MKTFIKVPLFAFALIFSVITLKNWFSADNNLPHYQPRKGIFNAPETGIRQAIDRYNLFHTNVNTGKVEVSDMIKSQNDVMQFMKKQNALKSETSIGLGWEEMGPDNVGGRTRAILFDRTNYNRMYAGQVSGGLWITNNGGISWKQWEPTGDLAWLNVSCLAQAVNGDVYVGTGEGFGLSPGGIESGNTMFVGSGIWKSIDGGSTFNPISSTTPDTNSSSGAWATVQRIGCDPVNSSKVYAATANGIMVSYNGGTNWTNPVKSTPCLENTGFVWDLKVTTAGAVFASIGNAPYYSPDGDTAIKVNAISDAGGYAQLDLGSAHNFSVGQRITVCGTTIPAANRGRQIISGVPSITSVVLESAYSASGADTGYVSSWISLSSTTDTLYVMDYSGAYRIEWAVCSTDPNYIYASICGTDRALLYLYQSNDAGATWNDLGMNLDLGDQGEYDNALAVYPDNCNKVIVGYVQMAHNKYGAWDYHSINFDPTGDGIYYIHADKHAVVFKPDYATSTDKKIFYGTDGGLFMSKHVNGLPIFQDMNNNYSTVQFYGLAIGPKGEVFGGTQDNGNPFIDPNKDYPEVEPNPPSTTTSRSMDYNLPSGDGAYGEISVINHDAFMWESQNAEAVRSPSRGVGPGSNIFGCSNLGNGIFVTPFILWESFNDTSSKEKVRYIDTTQIYNPGDTLIINSSNKNNGNIGFPFLYITPDTIHLLDTVYIKDIVQAKFFVILSNGVWMTKNILDFSKSPFWHRISDKGTSFEGQLAISKDGDHLFASTSGSLYRTDNINSIANPANPGTTCATTSFPLSNTKLIEGFSAVITHIAVDPNDANNVVVVLGQYGISKHVYRSSDALGASPSFTSIQGTTSFALPSMPVYSCLIEKHDKERVIIGTEYGMFATENAFDATPGNVRWSEENDGMSIVPVYQIRQQIHRNGYPSMVDNEGVIYISTHGRGFFKCTKYADLPNSIQEPKPAASRVKITVYPNPVSELGIVSFYLQEESSMKIEIYDLKGTLIKTIADKKSKAGNVNVKFDVCGFNKGIYFAILTLNGKRLNSARFAVIK